MYSTICKVVTKPYWEKGQHTSHLSKRPSDLKQNGTQEKTPFSGTVFHTLSHDVFHFVASGSSFKNHWIEAFDWLSKNLGVFFSFHSQQNWSHHVKGYWKLCQKLVSFLCTILFEVTYAFWKMWPGWFVALHQMPQKWAVVAWPRLLLQRGHQARRQWKGLGTGIA